VSLTFDCEEYGSDSEGLLVLLEWLVREKWGIYESCIDDPVFEGNRIAAEELGGYSCGDYHRSYGCGCNKDGDDEAGSVLDGEVA
jgi:hypothetical protein